MDQLADEQLIVPPPPHAHYRMAVSVRIFFLLMLMVLFAGAFWVVSQLVSKALLQQSFFPWVIALLAVAYASIFAYGILVLLRSGLLIQENCLLVREAFSTKRLLIEDIAGYRTDEKWTYIYSSTRPAYRLKVSNFVTGYGALRVWLATYFANLDLAQAWEEKEQLLDNPAFGRSPEEREAKLREARRLARILNWTGVLLSIWLFILNEFRQYYALSIAFALVFPWCLVLVLWFYRGLVGLHDQENGTVVRDAPLPSLMTALLFPALILVFRTFFDYDVLDYTPLWAPAAGICFLLALALQLGTTTLTTIKSARYGLYGTILVSSLAYGYGSAFLTNGLYDAAAPTHHQAQVLDMRTTEGKIDRYYLKLSPWGPRLEPDEIKVPGLQYKQLSVGDTVHLQLHPGWLKAPWYKVEVP